MAAILGTIGVIMVAVISQVLADDFKAWNPWLCQRLIGLAVRRLPDELQERYREEWSSHVAEIPGVLGKLLDSLRFSWAAGGIRSSWSKEKRAVFVAREQSTSFAPRVNFGLLPEPERSPASFLTSAAINLTILALVIYIGATAHRVIERHEIEVKKPDTRHIKTDQSIGRFDVQRIESRSLPRQ
jgi:hypothetical protein